MARAPATTARRWKLPNFESTSFALVFLGLPLAIYVIFVISPFVQAFYYSMTDWTGFSKKMNFVGLANYAALLQDPVFTKAVYNSIVLVVVLPPLVIILALTLATLVTIGGSTQGEIRGLKHSSLYRIISFFPYTVPAIVIGILWAQMYDPSSGLVNGILTAMGFDFFKSFAWLGDERTAMGASIFVIAWSMVGFYMVLFIAAIKGIPSEVYEAARVDGAGRFRTAISITVPMIRDNIRTAYVYLGILALDAFVYMQALNPSGGPANSTVVISQHLLNTAFKKGKFGYATSMGAALALITLLFCALVFFVFWWTGRPQKSGGITTPAAAPLARAVAAPTPAVEPKPTVQLEHPVAKRTIWTDQTVSTISHIALIAWVVIICAPLLWVLMSSFKTTQQIYADPLGLPQSLSFDNFINAWQRADLGRNLINSLVVTGGAVIVTIVVAAMAAYPLSRYGLKWGVWMLALFLAGIMLPIRLASVELFTLMRDLELLDSHFGLIAVYTAIRIPFAIFIFANFMRVLPRELEEAARLDGAGELRILFSIILPVVAPAVSIVAIFTTIAVWNDFFFPLIFIFDNNLKTVPLAITGFVGQFRTDWGMVFASLGISLAPVLAMYLLLARQIREGAAASGAVK